MLRYLPLVLAIAVVVWAFIECLQTPQYDVRNLPKVGWILLIVLVPVVGAVGWLVAGRPKTRGTGPRRPPPPGPRGPDDDPTFLRNL